MEEPTGKAGAQGLGKAGTNSEMSGFDHIG